MAGVVVEVVILKKAKARNIFTTGIFNIVGYIIDLDGLKGIKNDKNILNNN